MFVERTLGQTGQHVVLMYTDGGDTTSTMSYGKLQQLLRLGNVMVYVVGYLQNQAISDRDDAASAAHGIAHETGGDAFFPQSKEELTEIYNRILDELASRYTIGYVPSDPKIDGQFRKIAVKLASRAQGRQGPHAPGLPGVHRASRRRPLNSKSSSMRGSGCARSCALSPTASHSRPISICGAISRAPSTS